MSITINHPVNPAPANSQTWTTAEMTAEFDVESFGGGLIFVTHKSDGVRGILEFNGSPRVYHSFTLTI